MEIAFFFYSGMTALDVIGPHEILCRLPSAIIRRVAKQPGTVKTDSGVELIADYGFNEVPRADVLVVPGADSATDMRDEPDCALTLDEKALVLSGDGRRRTHAIDRLQIPSVCTATPVHQFLLLGRRVMSDETQYSRQRFLQQ
jgi:putative intracellular protease/amidase